MKVLHVLQRRRFQSVCGEQSISIDVRIMAVTNRDIAQDVASKLFRPDLFYRLAVVTLSIPPLHERREDIGVLIDIYLEYFCDHIRRNVTGTTPEALAALPNYPWPGNVRELVIIIERAMLLVPGDGMRVENLPASARRSRGHPTEIPRPLAHSTTSRELPAHVLKTPWRDAREATLVEFERAYLAALMKTTGGKINETARRGGHQAALLVRQSEEERALQRRGAGAGKRTESDPARTDFSV